MYYNVLKRIAWRLGTPKENIWDRLALISTLINHVFLCWITGGGEGGGGGGGGDDVLDSAVLSVGDEQGTCVINKSTTPRIILFLSREERADQGGTRTHNTQHTRQTALPTELPRQLSQWVSKSIQYTTQPKADKGATLWTVLWHNKLSPNIQKWTMVLRPLKMLYFKLSSCINQS